MSPRPLILIHGYSADEQAFHPLRDSLTARGLDLNFIDICSYISLNNEITIKDIAEGLARAFRYDANLNKKYDMNTCEFDAIVHSTGMLVLRSWLTNYGSAARGANARLSRLKHLIGIAPATWGSPQAHKGRTWLGALVKGNRELGPDFLNAGDAVLDGLELGSKFTWDLAHIDLLGKNPYYGKEANTPYVSIFIGNSPYTGLSSVANEPGTDGTVRWSGCGLNTRKITIDLTRFPTDENGNPAEHRLTISDWANDRLDVPLIAVNGRNHSTILSNPDHEMVDLIVDFLRVGVVDAANPDAITYDSWLNRATRYGESGKTEMLINPVAGMPVLTERFISFAGHLIGKNPDAPLEGWQQFIVHAKDERGDGINDYLLEVLRDENGKDVPFEEMYTDVHAYRADPSYRCFHIRLPQGISRQDASLKIRVHASSGTALIGYQGYKDLHSDQQPASSTAGEGQAMNQEAEPVILEVKDLGNGTASLFHPFTTTLIELLLSREPIPLDRVSEVLKFVQEKESQTNVGADTSGD
jgi:pimeloyl-ACP methyl ester carboxylesterase